MLRLTIFLLVAKTAFAVNAYPVDHTGYGAVGPDTNLVFNFQQLRRDQPSQVEMREENIHKYMNRPRTTPTPIDDGDMSPMRPEHPIPYTAEQWNAVLTAPKYEGPVANWKNVPAPPTFPHWDNLAATSPKQNYEHQYSQPIVVSEEPEWHTPEVHSRAVPSYSTVAPVTFAPVTFAPRSAMRQDSRSHSSRGNHRFNWSDVTTQGPTTMQPYAPAATSRMPPPAVPTLSPWYDGF